MSNTLAYYNILFIRSSAQTEATAGRRSLEILLCLSDSFIPSELIQGIMLGLHRFSRRNCSSIDPAGLDNHTEEFFKRRLLISSALRIFPVTCSFIIQLLPIDTH